MIKIQLPKDSIKYVLFQRTGYLGENYIFKLLTLLGGFKPFYKLSVDLKSFLFSSQIKNEFNRDIKKEYIIIKRNLPKKANSILDIGCGIAGIDLFVNNHYKNKIDIFLLDKTLTDKNVYYNFEKKGSFYNSLQISKKVLELNGVNPRKIHLGEATEDNKIIFSNNFDIVISLISWGFHYPISTYLNEVYNKLKKNGVLIVDIRKDTGGEKEIGNKFGNYKIIFESKKFIRVLAQK